MARWRRTDLSVPRTAGAVRRVEWQVTTRSATGVTPCLRWLREVEGRQLPFGEYGDSAAT
jgi:hypothetical protein